MNEPAGKPILCPGCGQDIEIADHFCRHCGQAILPSTPVAASKRQRLRDNPWFILSLLFLVLGPFGLPFLWSSRGFTWPAKVALSAFVLGIAIYVIWYGYVRVYGPLLEVLNELNSI